jgi:hypothetical protein
MSKVASKDPREVCFHRGVDQLGRDSLASPSAHYPDPINFERQLAAATIPKKSADAIACDQSCIYCQSFLLKKDVVTPNPNSALPDY